MSVYWTRARHAELPDVVMPVAALESCEGWEAVGEPSVDDAALRAELERERAAAVVAVLMAENAQPPAPPEPLPPVTTPEPDPEPPAPTDADPKEQ